MNIEIKREWSSCFGCKHFRIKEDRSAAGSNQYEELFLYDLHADPYELTNLVGIETYRSISDQLQEILIRYIDRIEG